MEECKPEKTNYRHEYGEEYDFIYDVTCEFCDNECCKKWKEYHQTETE